MSQYTSCPLWLGSRALQGLIAVSPLCFGIYVQPINYPTNPAAPAAPHPTPLHSDEQIDRSARRSCAIELQVRAPVEPVSGTWSRTSTMFRDATASPGTNGRTAARSEQLHDREGARDSPSKLASRADGRGHRARVPSAGCRRSR